MSNGVSRGPWWEEDPGRLDLELTHLRELTPESDWTVEDDRLVITTRARYQGENVPIKVRFSAEHPFVAPKLVGHELVLERHQHALGFNYCVIDNVEHWWRREYTAAMLLRELQGLLDATEAGQVEQGEVDAAEPFTGFIPGQPGRVVLVFDEALADDLPPSGGRFELTGFAEGRYLLARLTDEAGGVLAELPRELAQRLGGDRSQDRATGRWAAIDRPLAATDIDRVLHGALVLLKAEADAVPRAAGRRRTRPGGTTVWAGLTFFEQGPGRGQQRRAWLFYEGKTGPRGGIEEAGIPVKSQALSRAAREERMPELRGLAERRFLVVGAGALGGALVAELAKAGVGRIDVADQDVYDLNNGVRHVLPASAAGLAKVEALAAFANALNPFTDIAGHEFYLGGGEDERRRLEELIATADVVIDTTGAHQVTRLLHQRCVEAGGRPLVSAALSIGGFGGRIVVLRQPSPCFDCYRADASVVWPLEGPESNQTPYGCSHPAASCAGFDALELVASLVRTTVRVSEAVSYPELDFDWATVNFRPGGPRWSQGRLTLQAECPWCSAG